MTHEEFQAFLQKLYGYARTPLPGPPQIDPETLARWKAGMGALIPNAPTIPELPMAPQWLLDYGRQLQQTPQSSGILFPQQEQPPVNPYNAMNGVRG